MVNRGKIQRRNNMKYIGIDPGKSGGISIVTKNGIKAMKCPDSFYKMHHALKQYIGDTPPSEVYVFIEQVWAFPSDSNKTAFAFGTNYGGWQMACDIEEVNISLIRPRLWQGFFETPKSDKKTRKRWLKELAQGMCDFRVTFNTSDAILIAKFCQEKGGVK